jgi:glycosyltransferase involved in cell wall biosynthesis
MSTGSQNPNVLLLIPNLGRGGAQKVFLDQLEYLEKHFSVTGCVFNWDGAFESDKRINMVSLEVPAGNNVFTKIFYFFQRIIRLRKIKAKLNIHVCISHLEGADYVNILSKRLDNVVCWVHGTKQHDLNIHGPVGIIRMKLLMPFLYKRATQLVAVSKGIAEELVAYTRGNQKSIQVIYNGFDVADISISSLEEIDPAYELLFSQSKIIITHCRLSRQKNLDSLLSIMAKLKVKQPVKLVIAGDGELREQLLGACNRLGIKVWTVWLNTEVDVTAEVFFIGQQTNPFKFLRRSSLYIMTSQWEGFPLALCEAMACGLPVAVSDCFTGPREIIAPQLQGPQPVSQACATPYGILMPLVSTTDVGAIDYWVIELDRYLNLLHQQSVTEKAIERIKEFDLDESGRLTHQLVNELV